MKKLYHSINSLCESRLFPILYFPIAIGFLLLFSYTTSPFRQNDGCDSVIFKTMGLAILQRKIPYVDFFDHKGPILYFINALGQWIIHGRSGIFILQMVSFTMVLFFLHKTARVFVGGLLSVICVIVSLGLLCIFYEGGNLAEEWNLPYFVIPLYFAISYFSKDYDKPHPKLYGLFYGICFGMAFYIRPNDAVAQIGGIMAGVVLWLLYRKSYNELWKNILFFIIGFIIVSAPILAWFGYNNALGAMFYGLFQFNTKYAEGIIGLLFSVIKMNKMVLLVFFISLIIVAHKTTFKKILFVLIPISVLVLLLMGSRPYNHYYIVILPYLMLLFVLICLQDRLVLMLIIAVAFVALPLCFYVTKSDFSKEKIIKIKNIVLGIKEGRDESEFYEETDKLLEFIPEEERTEIWNYNLDFDISMLWHQGLVQINKVPLFSMYKIDSKLKEEDNITSIRPKYVLFSEFHDKDSSDYAYIENNYYKMAQTDSTVCGIILYKRN